MNKQQRLHELKVKQQALSLTLNQALTTVRMTWAELFDITEEINEVESELDYE